MCGITSFSLSFTAKIILEFGENQRNNSPRQLERNVWANATFNCGTSVVAQGSAQDGQTVHRLWYRNGSLLGPPASDKRFRFQPEPNTKQVATILKIKNLSLTDSGLYRCVVWVDDPLKNLTASFRLNVKTATTTTTTTTTLSPETEVDDDEDLMYAESSKLLSQESSEDYDSKELFDEADLKPGCKPM